MHHGYSVGLFDVLGFERRFEEIGLEAMKAKYLTLIYDVDHLNAHRAELEEFRVLEETAYWAAGGEAFFYNKVHGAYASDSILLWANRTWPDARGKDTAELSRLSRDPSKEWLALPIPCDLFLDACSELICHSLEVGLPLRGAISLGQAFFDSEQSVFLGQPIIDSARLEQEQLFIGAGLCAPFAAQTIPPRYLLRFDQHLRDERPQNWSGFVLDWPRRWRKTRRQDLASVVQAMNTDSRFSRYYENTLAMAAASLSLGDAAEETSIRAVYKQFSYSKKDLSMNVIAVARPSK